LLAEVLSLSSVLEVVVREELRDFVIQQGMSALTKILEAERTALCGAPYERSSKPARRAGSAPGELVMGGRKVSVKRPRVRDEEGEISLASYQQFSEDNPLAHRVLSDNYISPSCCLMKKMLLSNRCRSAVVTTSLLPQTPVLVFQLSGQSQ